MAISSLDDLIIKTTDLMSGTADSLDPTALESAASQALSEVGWSFPINDTVKQHWAIERCRRHILYVLMNVAALKFQYKQIHLEHRFKHLSAMIEQADSKFQAFVEDNPSLFVDSVLSDMDREGFMTYITNGFAYDPTGIQVDVPRT